MRRLLSTQTMDARGPYDLLTRLVVPRPIAWISTVSPSGVANLAPHSFFTVASQHPPVVQFTSVGRKDTLTNIEATGEFVVNLAPESMLEEVNGSSAPFPAGVGEFEALGIAPEASERVAPPRVAGSPAALECRLHRVVEVGDCFLVLGEVLCFAIDEAVLDADRPDRPRPMMTRMRPLARLGGAEWGLVGEVVSVLRPTSPEQARRA